MGKNYSRRRFIERTLGAGVALAGSQIAFSGSIFPENKTVNALFKYDPKGLPTAVLGKTGVVIPRIALGLGSRFCNIKTTDEALEMITFALDNGLYYWDTAHAYTNTATGVISEERLGHIVKLRRKEIFLSTKVTARDTEKAKAEIEDSLKRLQTDKLDMLKIHSVDTAADVKEILKKGGVLDHISKLKEEGVTRFIGFTGHGNAQSLIDLASTGRFDSMLFAMNHYDKNKENRQGLVIPAARQKGMGVMMMKTIRPKETIEGMDPGELVRFALSLEGPDGIAVGVDSKKVVESNLNILRNFKPMSDTEKMKYAEMLSPFFRHEKLEWMRKEYRDGLWG